MNSNTLWKILQKSSFIFLLILVGCSQTTDVQKEVQVIDAEYGVALSQYNYGVSYFRSFLRIDPINQEDYDVYCARIKTVQGKNEKSQQYVSFRYNLCMAEKEYRHAIFFPKSDFGDGSILCKNENITLESLGFAEQSISYMQQAILIFPSIEDEIVLNSTWIERVGADNEIIIKEIVKKKRLIAKFC